MLGDVFGIEMADSAPPKRHKPKTSTTRKPPATVKPPKVTKAAKATIKKSSAKPSAKCHVSNTATVSVGKAGKSMRSAKAPKATNVVKSARVRMDKA